jgi:hypothetical protein
MIRWLSALVFAGVMLNSLAARETPPEVAAALYDGKLVAGAKTLEERLAKNAGDDQARAALGVVQFLRGFEKLGAGLYRYGLKTHSQFPGMPRRLAALIPENPKPEKVSYANFRKLVEEFVNDIEQAEKTLAQVKDAKVQLSLYPGRLKVDLFGQGQLVSAGILVGVNDGRPEEVAFVEGFLIDFDRGDVSWLRGYLHFLCAWGELLLALDTQDLFEDSAHRLFFTPETPHKFFLEEDRDNPMRGGFWWGNWEFMVDAFSAVYHGANLPIKEPARMKKALEHLEGMVAQGKEMWTHILAETDDSNEWIPNPKQTGVLRIEVSEKILKEWQTVLTEVDEILQGKRLLPFWRGKRDGSVGLNLRKVFTNPPARLDIVRWTQGPAATPYLEQGPITPLADPRVINRMNGAFGPIGVFGFAFWFN